MKVSLPDGFEDCLLWSDELGRGFHTKPAMTYDGDYFAKYQEMDKTPMGEALTNARCEFVSAHHSGVGLVDIGIGGGRFVEQFECMGFDVSAQAVEWLKGRKAWHNVMWHGCDAITCWDSLEHIPDPDALINNVKSWVFVSMPIYLDKEHCLASKHYKPGEHLHYWTQDGLIKWFESLGFELFGLTNIESVLGREGITSYAFKRVNE